MILAILLFTIGMALSAFFSGSETGFYRMTRLRLVIDAMAGDWVSRCLLWFANQPSAFVATTLVGNNLANYLASLSVVMATHWLAPHGGTLSEILAPILIAPVIFIAGELLPKNLFYQAPNRLLRRCAPALVFSAILFAPITLLLWALSMLLKLFAKETPQELRLHLARRELGKLLTEGHEAGILKPVQRTLAQSMLAMAGQPVKNFASARSRSARLTTTMRRSEALRIAQHHGRTLLPVEEVKAGDDGKPKRRLVGFIRTTDLFLNNDDCTPEAQPFVELRDTETFLSAMTKFSQSDDALGRISDAAGATVGFVTGRELRMALFRDTL